MTLATFEQLLSTHGQTALKAAIDLAPSEAKFLQAFEKLRKRFDAELTKAALEMAMLRVKAKNKFPHADAMYFLREALEQATHHTVAIHRAKRFQHFKTVLDLGCGLGADAIALAEAGCHVIAVERDPLRARMADANVAALGMNVKVMLADGLVDSLPPCEAIFCDPARRDGSKRHLATEAYTPAPREVIARFADLPIAFKLAPGIAWHDLGDYDGEAEFVSLGGELKECTLWLGSFVTKKRRATVLPSGVSLAADEVSYDREIASPRAFIYLPDSTVIRSGLEPQLAAELDAAFLDATGPLLTADELMITSLATAYRFDALLTGAVSHLTAALRERNVGRVTFLNIGSPREVESVRKSVKLKGSEHREVILTRIGGAAAALIVELIAASH